MRNIAGIVKEAMGKSGPDGAAWLINSLMYVSMQGCHSSSAFKSLRADICPRPMDQVFFRELVAAAESPSIDFLKTCTADDAAQVFAIFEGEGRDDPEVVGKHDFLDAAPHKRIAPQRAHLCGQLQTMQIRAAVEKKLAHIRH